MLNEQDQEACDEWQYQCWEDSIEYFELTRGR